MSKLFTVFVCAVEIYGQLMQEVFDFPLIRTLFADNTFKMAIDCLNGGIAALC